MKTFFFLIAILLGLSITQNSTAQSKPSDFGPEYTFQEIEKAFDNVKRPPLLSINVGEFAYSEFSTTVPNSSVTVIYKQQSMTVTKKQFCNEGNQQLPPCSYFPGQKGFVIGLVTEIRELDQNGNMKPSQSFNYYFIPVSKLAIDLMGEIKMSSQKYTYHNLSVVYSLQPIPDLVQKRSDCGGLGLENCQKRLKSTNISFDVVDWAGFKPEIRTYAYSFSQDVPYLASQLLACLSSSDPGNFGNCMQVKDFTFGE
jgi:hypothetical protein